MELFSNPPPTRPIQMKFMFKLKPEIEAIPDDTPIPPPDDGRLSLAPKRSLGGVIEA